MATDTPFHFAGFNFYQSASVHKIGTDALALATYTKIGAARNVLDIGCGTGILALALVAMHPELIATAIDSSKAAYDQTMVNVLANQVQDRVTVLHTDLYQYCAAVPKKSFDCIVSNPPYFSETMHSTRQTRKEARQQSALPPTQFMEACSQLLQNEGKLWIIIPDTQVQNYREQACLHGLYFNLEVRIIRAGVQSVGRTIVCFSREAAKFARGEHHVFTRESV
jgi:tRNA1Val (adenine37-N6)-methyltransferase